MAYNSGSTITCVVHGDDSPYKDAHHDPNIKLKFTATISRSGNNVKVKLSGMKFWVSGPGGYGYKLSVYARATAGSTTYKAWTKLDKSTCTENKKWTRHPSSVTLTCYDNLTTTVYVQIGAYSSDKKQCYGSSTKRIAGYAFKAPAANYTIKYNANGGTVTSAPAYPNGQVISYGTPKVQLLGTEHYQPVYYTPVTYWDNGPDESPDNPREPTANEVPTPDRKFLSWNTKADGTGTNYAINQVITPANLNLYAQWGNAEFECDTPTYKDYVITFVPNNGAANIEKPFHRQSTYNTDPTGTGTSYIPYADSHVKSITTTPLDLYPIYGSVLIRATDLIYPPEIINPGFEFDCWCLDSQLQHPIEFNGQGYYEINRPISLYARWIPYPLWQKNQGDWESINPYAWKCITENGVKKWKHIAHVCECFSDGGVKYWKDVSEQQRSE